MNIVLINADDLGYGDVESLNPDGKIPTTHVNRLCEQGVIFTDAHAGDSICHPSRYGLLTGRYSWRTARKAGNPNPGEQPWIETGRTTMATLLQSAGYDTAVVGKLAMGADWNAAAKPGRRGIDLSPEAIDYSQHIYEERGIGFDYEHIDIWFGREYYTTDRYKRYNEKHMLEETDGGRWVFENGVSQGGGPPRFDEFDMSEVQLRHTRKVVEYIDTKGGTRKNGDFNTHKGAPFFLYYAPAIPHYPHFPADEFIGKSGCGVYGDYVMQFDWLVGQVVEALERNNLRKDTLLIVTSDNGPEMQCYHYIDSYDHASMGEWRGVKRDTWEGGHRVPFVVSWPEATPDKRYCNRMVSQLDIIATVADLLGLEMPAGTAEDAHSFAGAILPSCPESRPERRHMVHHSANNDYALRSDNWLLVEGPTGQCSPEPDWFRERRGVIPHEQPRELFDLSQDPQQLRNLFVEQPEKATALLQRLNELRSSWKKDTEQ